MPSAIPVERVLVTGATGVRGRAVVAALAASGFAIRTLSRRGPDARHPAAPNVEASVGDLLRAGSLRAALEGCDVVVHAAAPVRFGGDGGRRLTVGGTETLLREAQASGARVFVLVGWAGTVQERDDAARPVDEDTPPEGRYEAAGVRAIYEAESMTLEANDSRAMRTLVVSSGELLRPRDGGHLGALVDLYVEEELPGRILESAWIAPSDAEEVGRCVVTAIQRGLGGRRYFATGDSFRLADLYAVLGELSGVAPPRRRLPDLLVEELGHLAPVLPARSFLKRLLLPRDLVAHWRRLAPLRNPATRVELAFAPRSLRELLAESIGGGVSAAGRRGIGG